MCSRCRPMAARACSGRRRLRPEADHDIRGPARLRTHLQQQAAELAMRVDDVVRPFQLHVRRTERRAALRRRRPPWRGRAPRNPPAFRRTSTRSKMSGPEPNGASHSRPRRPRPAVCSSANSSARLRPAGGARRRAGIRWSNRFRSTFESRPELHPTPRLRPRSIAGRATRPACRAGNRGDRWLATAMPRSRSSRDRFPDRRARDAERCREPLARMHTRRPRAGAAAARRVSLIAAAAARAGAPGSRCPAHALHVRAMRVDDECGHQQAERDVAATLLAAVKAKYTRQSRRAEHRARGRRSQSAVTVSSHTASTGTSASGASTATAPINVAAPLPPRNSYQTGYTCPTTTAPRRRPRATRDRRAGRCRCREARRRQPADRKQRLADVDRRSRRAQIFCPGCAAHWCRLRCHCPACGCRHRATDRAAGCRSPTRADTAMRALKPSSSTSVPPRERRNSSIGPAPQRHHWRAMISAAGTPRRACNGRNRRRVFRSSESAP